ncbi:YggT family protein [Streptococcus dentiloxodontae]
MIAYLLILLSRLITVYSWILIIYALLSWFPGAYDTWFGRLLHQLSEPILRPLRRFNLTIAGLDFTIMVAIVLMQVLYRLVVIILI